MRRIVSRLIHSSYSPLPNHTPLFVKDTEAITERSQLKNGIKVITESSKFPNCINLGLIFQIGSRDDPEGCLEIFKDLFLKSSSLSDQLQYSILELSGCEVTLTIDRETIYIHASCLEEHLDKVIKALKHSIFPRVIEKDVKKACENFNELLEPETTENKFKNMFIPSAYAGVNLGFYSPRLMPITADLKTFQKFVSEYFTADRMSIAATGVKDHSSFIESIGANFAEIAVKSKRSPKSVYTGGYVREEIDEEMTSVTLGFEGASFFDKEMPAFAVLKAIIGEGGGFSTGGPGKGMHSRAYTKILPYGFLESVKAINHSFTDSGVFGISLVGLERYSEYILDLILKEMVDLLQVSEEELARAKNIITREALINYQKSQSRIEDIAKNCAYFYKTPEEFGYLHKINAVSLADLKVALIKMMRSRFTVNVLSKKTSKIPDIAHLYSKLGRTS